MVTISVLDWCYNFLHGLIQFYSQFSCFSNCPFRLTFSAFWTILWENWAIYFRKINLWCTYHKSIICVNLAARRRYDVLFIYAFRSWYVNTSHMAIWVNFLSRGSMHIIIVVKKQSYTVSRCSVHCLFFWLINFMLTKRRLWMKKWVLVYSVLFRIGKFVELKQADIKALEGNK